MEYTLEYLRANTVNTIYAFDVMNPIKSIFVGWQEGSERTFIEVQSCEYMKLSTQDAIEMAEERMLELNREQDGESDVTVVKSLAK
jgi:hypothetical protein